MKITIDGHSIPLEHSDKSIVEVATRAGIGIPAACDRADHSDGCCRACVVEIDGEPKFACVTAPEDGMEIVLDRADLKALRKERLLKYKEGLKSGNPCTGDCSDANACCD